MSRDRVTKFRQLPASQRRNVRLYSKCKKKRVAERFYDRDTLFSWAQEKGIESQAQLLKKRRPGEPNVDTFKKVFGSWNDYRKEAGLKKWKYRRYSDDLIDPPSDLDYLVRTMIECDLWTRTDWVEKRKQDPGIIPPITAVERECGTWENLRVLAMQESLRLTLRRYLALRRRYGRPLYKNECEKEGIDITPWIKKFGTKREFESILDDMEKAEEDALRRRSERESN